MNQYDTVLKSLLTNSKNLLIKQITGATNRRWLNVELPKVAQPRVDLLFEVKASRDRGRRIIQLELQSRNDLWLPIRMAEYGLAVYRVHQIFPEQYVLYVGREKLRMPTELAGRNHLWRYSIVDISEFDAEVLMESPFATDNILAILARSSNKLAMVRRILERIAQLETAERAAAFAKLAIVAGLRQLESTVRREAKQMPITDDIMDHQIIGPAIRKGLKRGREEGLEEGRKVGMLELVRRQMTERFGRVPVSADRRLNKMSAAELEEVGARLLHAKRLADLFQQR